MICHPFKAETFCSIKTSKKIIYLLIITCLFLNIPKFFEYQTEYVKASKIEMRNTLNQKFLLLSLNRHNRSLQRVLYRQLFMENIFNEGKGNLTNTTQHESLKAIISLTKLGTHPFFITIIHLGVYLIFVTGLPLIFLLYFNFKLMKQVRRARKQAKLLARVERRRTDTTIMLIGVVVVFFTCQIPALFSRVFYVIFKTGETLQQWVLFVYVNEASNTLAIAFFMFFCSTL